MTDLNFQLFLQQKSRIFTVSYGTNYNKSYKLIDCKVQNNINS